MRFVLWGNVCRVGCRTGLATLPSLTRLNIFIRGAIKWQSASLEFPQIVPRPRPAGMKWNGSSYILSESSISNHIRSKWEPLSGPLIIQPMMNSWFNVQILGWNEKQAELQSCWGLVFKSFCQSCLSQTYCRPVNDSWFNWHPLSIDCIVRFQ